MAPRTDKQLEKLKTKKQKAILEAALQVFAAKGYSSASMNEVAKTAKVSKGNIYNYFESKEKLLKAIIEEGFKELFEFFEIEQIKEVTNENLENYVWYTMDSFLKKFEHWKVYFALLMQAEVHIIVEADFWKMAIPFMQGTQEYFEKKGSENAYVEMRVFFAILDGIGLNQIADPENFPLKEATQMIINKFIYNR
ncbi:MAG: TetR/AcrR family transcriptional regulator [Bacteroidales bacterium]|nr:TetR/AcrR family transcriptional regulator [Bacteroidales bacterium]